LHQNNLTPKLKVKLSETEREMVKQRKLKRDELFELDKSSEEKFKLKGKFLIPYCNLRRFPF